MRKPENWNPSDGFQCLSRSRGSSLQVVGARLRRVCQLQKSSRLSTRFWVYKRFPFEHPGHLFGQPPIDAFAHEALLGFCRASRGRKAPKRGAKWGSKRRTCSVVSSKTYLPNYKIYMLCCSKTFIFVTNLWDDDRG